MPHLAWFVQFICMACIDIHPTLSFIILKYLESDWQWNVYTPPTKQLSNVPCVGIQISYSASCFLWVPTIMTNPIFWRLVNVGQYQSRSNEPLDCLIWEGYHFSSTSNDWQYWLDILIWRYGGSINWGTPKSSILVRFSITNHPAIGVPPFMETLMLLLISILVWLQSPELLYPYSCWISILVLYPDSFMETFILILLRSQNSTSDGVFCPFSSQKRSERPETGCFHKWGVMGYPKMVAL